MKKIIITLLTMCFIMTGCFGADKALKERNQAQQPAAVSLTLENVSKAILAEGLELMPTATPEKDWILNKVEPNRFQVGSPKENTDPAKLEQISIYVFVSENDRNKGLDDFNKQKEAYNMMIPRIYEAQNVMVFYWAHANMDEPTQLGQPFQNIIDRLNNKL